MKLLYELTKDGSISVPTLSKTNTGSVFPLIAGSMMRAEPDTPLPDTASGLPAVWTGCKRTVGNREKARAARPRLGNGKLLTVLSYFDSAA